MAREVDLTISEKSWDYFLLISRVAIIDNGTGSLSAK